MPFTTITPFAYNMLEVATTAHVDAGCQELVASRNEAPFLKAVTSALQQAVQSYAPYSHCPSGLAIVTAQGTVYSGPYLESAAFNPSLGPLQAAVIDAVTDGIAYYTEVSCLLSGRDCYLAQLLFRYHNPTSDEIKVSNSAKRPPFLSCLGTKLISWKPFVCSLHALGTTTHCLCLV